MLLSNAFRPDPRVAREAEGLARAGHSVTVVCWDRQVQFAPREMVGDYRVERVQDVPTVYGAGVRQILHTPRFWRAAAARARNLQPDVIHCHDLDTLPVGWWLKARTGARLVYDAHEDYPAMMSLYLPSLMVWMLSWLERRLLRRVDHTITASTVFADKLRDQGIAPVATIGNYQSLVPFDTLNQSGVAAARSRLGLTPDDLVVAYIGGFTRNRKLLPLIEAAGDMPDVQILLWGDGHQRAIIEAAVSGVSNARYLGWLPAEQVPLYTKLADIIYYCLEPNYPGAIYNAPNTLSNAMAAGRPIIANDVGDLGRIVRQTGCGILVSDTTSEAVRHAVTTLRDPAVRKQMGAAGRSAAETHYSWTAAKEQLQQIYTEFAKRG